MSTKTSSLIIQLIDRVSAPARGIERALGGINAAIARNNARMDAVRGQLFDAAAAGYGLYKALSAPMKAAANFESLMLDIGQKADLSDAAIGTLGKRIRELAPALGALPTEMAGGIDTLMGMGLDQGRAMEIIAPITRAAKAYNAEVTDLSKAGVAALDNLKVPAGEFAKALDVMAYSGKAGAFELKDMAQYLPAISAQAQNLGIVGVKGVADLGAALQIVRKGAGDSSEAATNLRNVLQKVESPATRKNFWKLGIDISKALADGAKKGTSPIETLVDATRKAMAKGAKLSDLFEDAQVQQGLLALMQNMEEYRRIRAEALQAQGVVEEDFARRAKTASFQLQRFQARMQNLGIIVGKALLPALNDALDALTPIIQRVADFAEAHPELTKNLALAAAALTSFRVAALGLRWAGLFGKGAALQVAAGFLSITRLIDKLTGGALGGVSRAAATAPIDGFATYGERAGHAMAGRLRALMAGGTLLSFIPEILADLNRTAEEKLAASNASAAQWKGLEKWLDETAAGQFWKRLQGGGEAKSAGAGIGSDFAAGIRAKTPDVVTAAQEIMDRIRAAVGAGISIPIKPVMPSGGLGTPLGAYKREPGYTPLPGISGSRALGGRVAAGNWYRINERGQELFAPGQAGAILSNAGYDLLARAGRGMAAERPAPNVGPFNISITVNGAADPRRIAEDLGREVQRRMAGSHFDN